MGVTVAGGWFEHCAFHGYWADDYQTLDPRFGTEAELKALVQRFKDVVAAHSATGFPQEPREQLLEAVKAALANDLIPIVCVGETLAEYAAGTDDAELRRQCLAAVEEGRRDMDGSPLREEFERLFRNVRIFDGKSAQRHPVTVTRTRWADSSSASSRSALSRGSSVNIRSGSRSFW